MTKVDYVENGPKNGKIEKKPHIFVDGVELVGCVQNASATKEKKPGTWMIHLDLVANKIIVNGNEDADVSG